MARGGHNGFNGLGNMGNIMRQAQKMQQDMEKKKDELGQRTVEVTVGGGAVYVKMNGRKEIVEMKIKPEVIDPEDVEMLEDLVVVAVNEVIKKVEDMFETEMSKIAPSIPGLF